MIHIAADVMLLDDLAENFMKYLRAAEVVTPTEWSSQVVMWRAPALNDFCDAMVEHVRMQRAEQHEVFRMGTLFIKHSEWTDMCVGMVAPLSPLPRHPSRHAAGLALLRMHHPAPSCRTFLAAYLRTLRPERSRIVLCGTPAAKDEVQCTRLKWAYAIGTRIVEGNRCATVAACHPPLSGLLLKTDMCGIAMLMHSTLAHCRECRQLNQTLEWRQPGGPGSPLQAWTRYTYWPAVGRDKLAGEGPPERLPLIHFLSPDCKPVAREVYMREFVGRQLLPDLTTIDAVASNGDNATVVTP